MKLKDNTSEKIYSTLSLVERLEFINIIKDLIVWLLTNKLDNFDIFYSIILHLYGEKDTKEFSKEQRKKFISDTWSLINTNKDLNDLKFTAIFINSTASSNVQEFYPNHDGDDYFLII